MPDGRVGYVCEPTVQGVADAIARMYDGDTIERFRLNCIEERKRFSWEEMCTRIAELYEWYADSGSRGWDFPRTLASGNYKGLPCIARQPFRFIYSS